MVIMVDATVPWNVSHLHVARSALRRGLGGRRMGDFGLRAYDFLRHAAGLFAQSGQTSWTRTFFSMLLPLFLRGLFGIS
jgi:hypothetical protein